MLLDQILDSCSIYDKDVLSKIEDKLEEKDGCLVWTGQYHNQTPVRSFRGKRTSVRQLVYRMTRVAEYNQRLTTSCQTRGCLDPDHMVPWDGPGNEFANRNRKLAPDELAEILATPRALKGSGKQLAERFDVSPSLVSRIRRKSRRTTIGSV